MGKATPKLVATGSHTPRLEGWKEEVVVPQLRAWGCLMDPETTKDTDTKGVVQPLLGRHQRQRRKGEIFLLLPSFGPLISQWKTLQNTSWHGAQAARTTFAPMPPKAQQGRVRNESENKQAMVWSTTKGRCFRDNASFVHSISHLHVPLY